MSKKDRKMTPKWSKNDAKMAPKLIPKSSFSRHGDFMESVVFPIGKTHISRFRASKKCSKIEWKTFQNRCSKKRCKNDAKSNQKVAKMGPKSIKNPSKMKAKKTMNFRREAGQILGSPGSPKTHTIQQDKQQINYRKTKKEDNLQKITYRTSSKGNLLIDDLQS